MNDLEITNYLKAAGYILDAISLGTDKASVSLGYHKDLEERNRYSLTLRECSWKGLTGWGQTPDGALADLRRREVEAARQDAITAKVERYRTDLENGVAR